MSTPKKIPLRAEVPAKNCWNLDSLYPSDSAWEEDLKILAGKIEPITSFQGKLHTSAQQLADCLHFITETEILDERLGYYAHLRYSEDAGDSTRQDRWARYLQLSTRISTAASFLAPEILSIPDSSMQQFLTEDCLQDFGIYLHKILRNKPYTLSEKEERLLAMQAEANQTASKTFNALNDVDMDFGAVATPEGEIPLSHSSFGSLLQHSDRNIRKQAYNQFYQQYEAHKNTLASLYSGSIQLDIYRAKVRGFSSARAAKLFADDVPESVYETLIEQVHAAFPTLHRYYALRAKQLGLHKIHMYDTKVPLIPDVRMNHSYTEAVDLVCEAVAPLGSEYVSTMRDGLLGGWVDRYENRGKRSGAFSAGSYQGDPYILLNYKQDVLRDVFTLAHEAGHSMHSWYSARSNPFQHYQYTIFEAEVASTFNEQLVFTHLQKKYAADDAVSAYLINLRIDDILATLIRQTMFAEYEHICHSMAEQGKALTVDSLRSSYAELQKNYFGSAVEHTEIDNLEGLRIPHFYRAFYVYKYATGISAAITLANGVLQKNGNALENYFSFLRSGGSRFPLESLQKAGVNLRKPDAVQHALHEFSRLVELLENCLQ